jgi:N-acetylneuraminic acid mutarotase
MPRTMAGMQIRGRQLSPLAAALAVAFLGLTGPASADSGGWRPGTSSLVERAEVSAAVVDHSIYVVGGFIGPTTTNQVERYDVRRDRWELLKPMPVALNHPSAVAYGGDLYVLGGYTNGVSTPGVPTGGLLDTSDAFLRYDPRTNSWSEMPRMPGRRSAAAAAVVGDRLYVAGGRSHFPTYATSEGLLARLDIFDFSTRTWSRGPDMSIAREHVAGAAAAGAFYVIGGRTVLDSVAAVERYLPAKGRWERVAEMRVPHNGFPAVTVGDRIVVFGAEEPSNAQLRTHNEATELFDPATGRWSALPDMRTPRGGHTGAVVGRRVYAIDGILAAPTTTAGAFTNLVETLDLPLKRGATGGCLSRRAPIGPRNIGRIRLGLTRGRLLRLPVQPAHRTRHTFHYCVKGGMGAVTAVFGRRGRAQLVTTLARSHGNRGVRVGSSSTRFARAYTRRRRIGRGLYRANPRSPRLFGMRRGHIRMIAVASRRLLGDSTALGRALRRAGVHRLSG